MKSLWKRTNEGRLHGGKMKDIAFLDGVLKKKEPQKQKPKKKEDMKIKPRQKPKTKKKKKRTLIGPKKRLKRWNLGKLKKIIG
jgi:hypothetical protein